MRYSKEKAEKLNRTERALYLSKYHDWLKQERNKDKEKVPYKYVSTGQFYLKNNVCPYCKKELEIKHKNGLDFKYCKEHGLVQIRK